MFNLFKKQKKSSTCCGVKIEEIKDEKQPCCDMKVEEETKCKDEATKKLETSSNES